MTAIRYTPASRGTWLVIAVPYRLLVLERRSAEGAVDPFWEALGPSGGVQLILDELTRGGISNAPAFALASWTPELDAKGGPLNIIVRGDLSVVVHSDAAPVELDGHGVSTWNERVVPGAVGAEIRIDSAHQKHDPSGSTLWLETGMVWASQVQIGAPRKAEAKEPSDARAPQQPPPDDGVPSETTKTDFTVSEFPPNERPDETPDSEVSDESGYDYLFGETIARTVEDAAVRSDGDDTLDEGRTTSNTDASDVELEGDHDGKTAIGLDRATRQAARRARAQKSVEPLAPSGPKLFIVLSSGTSEELNQPVLIGRAPSVSKVSGGSLPRLVTITGTDQDISRNHVQVAVEGGTVVITDLHSRNGTMVVLPGRPPQQLRAGEPTAVIVGTVVDLGAGVTFTVREG